MTKNTKKNDTALIGCGYWGTNIAKVLTKIKKNKITIYDENRSNSIILNKRFPDKTIICTKKLRYVSDQILYVFNTHVFLYYHFFLY